MLNELMDQFNRTYQYPTHPVSHAQQAMIKLIKEEVTELEAELGQDEANFIKEAIDLIYITAQQLRSRKVNIDAALLEVHRSNLSKILDIDKLSAKEVTEELRIARKRYPAAYVQVFGANAVLKCASTNKVIKPTTYSVAKINKDYTCG